MAAWLRTPGPKGSLAEETLLVMHLPSTVRLSVIVSCSLLVFAACSVAAANSSSSQYRHGNGCSPPAGAIVARDDGRAWIYRLRSSSTKDAVPKGAMYGCLRSQSEAWKLGPQRNVGGEMRRPTAFGLPWAAATEVRQARREGLETIVEGRNLRTGKRSRCLVHRTHAKGGLQAQIAHIGLKPDGAIAWSGTVGRQPKTLQVVACDAAGRRILDEGEGIVVNSLRLNGSRLTWRDASGRREAEIR